MLQIGLNGLLIYVKASQRSSIIDELLTSKDYISEIVTIAADHFTTVSRLRMDMVVFTLHLLKFAMIY